MEKPETESSPVFCEKIPFVAVLFVFPSSGCAHGRKALYLKGLFPSLLMQGGGQKELPGLSTGSIDLSDRAGSLPGQGRCPTLVAAASASFRRFLRRRFTRRRFEKNTSLRTSNARTFLKATVHQATVF
eukprot:2427087-Amphidinium_carterae.1